MPCGSLCQALAMMRQDAPAWNLDIYRRRATALFLAAAVVKEQDLSIL
ncbi:MAG: hypothetical protein LBU39_08215 [Desulfobulbaceae bacterium]|nr:hypothetical protein [Desulfobulbaceae bacterium]